MLRKMVLGAGAGAVAGVVQPIVAMPLTYGLVTAHVYERIRSR